MPGNNPGARPGPTERKGSRKPRPHGFARQRMAPAHRVEHVLETCPDCGTGLAGGWTQRTREVIEVPVAPAEVTEHVFVARVCPVCERRRTPKADLGGVVRGQGRLGVNLVSLIVALREEGRLPIRTIQWYLETVHQLRLSAGGITQVLHGVARRAQQAVAEVLELVRTSKVVHADETGWRQDGKNGYVWTFSTSTERYFLRRGRDKGVVDEALGESFSGVLVSDFYAAYNHYPGPKQRCWAHLLRDIHDLKALYPEDAKLARWAAAVHNLYTQAKTRSDQGTDTKMALASLFGTWRACPRPGFQRTDDTSSFGDDHRSRVGSCRLSGQLRIELQYIKAELRRNNPSHWHHYYRTRYTVYRDYSLDAEACSGQPKRSLAPSLIWPIT